MDSLCNNLASVRKETFKNLTRERKTFFKILYVSSSLKHTHQWHSSMSLYTRIDNIAMQNILILVLIVASIASASISGLNVAQVVYAASSTTGTCPCGHGDPHVADPDTGIVPKGNAHDFESNLNNGNPHIKG